MVPRTPENTPVTQAVAKEIQEKLSKNISALTTSPEAARTAAQARVKAVTDQQNKTQKEFSDTAQKEATTLFEALGALAGPDAMTAEQRVTAITAVFGDHAVVTGVGTTPNFTGVTVQMRYPEYTRNPQTEMDFFLARLPDAQRTALQDNADFKAFRAALPGLDRPLQLAIIDLLPWMQTDPAASLTVLRRVSELSAEDRTVLFREVVKTPNPFEPVPPATVPNTIPESVRKFYQDTPVANRPMILQLATNLGTVRTEEQNAEQQRKNAEAQKKSVQAAREQITALRGGRNLADMTERERDKIRGTVMMQKGVSVEWNGTNDFIVTAATDGLGKILNHIQGALIMWGYIKNNLDEVRGKVNGTTNAPIAPEPIPENATPVERSRLNGVNFLNAQTTPPAVTRQGITNTFTSAAAPLGITGQPRSAVTFAFNNNRWEVTVPGFPLLTNRPVTELTEDAMKKGMATMAPTGSPAEQKAIADNRAVLAARITQLATFEADRVESQQKTMTEGITKLSSSLGFAQLEYQSADRSLSIVPPSGATMFQIDAHTVEALTKRLGTGAGNTVVATQAPASVAPAVTPPNSHTRITISNMTPERMKITQDILAGEMGRQTEAVRKLADRDIRFARRGMDTFRARSRADLPDATRKDVTDKISAITGLANPTMDQLREATAALNRSVEAMEVIARIELRKRLGNDYIISLNPNINGAPPDNGYYTKQTGAWTNYFLYMRFNADQRMWQVSLGNNTQYVNPIGMSASWQPGNNYRAMCEELALINARMPV